MQRAFQYLKRAFQYLNSYAYLIKHKNKIGLKQKDYFKLKKFGLSDQALQEVLFQNRKIKITSPFWFLHSVDEIFVEEVYRFTTNNPRPLIIDCGSNIGLSILYFKQLFKNAEVVAFEADPAIFKILESNLEAYNIDNIRLINAAVWKEDTSLSFESEGSVGGKIGAGATNKNRVQVPAKRLRNYLSGKVDFLKIDIEGAEYEVLKDCKDLLLNVENLFIEYHVLPNETQRLHEILEWVHAAGLRYYIREAWGNMKYPFTKTCDFYYQLQLNIFCYRN